MPASELLGKVRRLEIRSRHLVEDLFAGQSESVFKGRGIEFEEVRPYAPGDEVRDLDWNVTARLNAPFVKRFVEERELTVMLVADISRSMRFGTAGVEKRELAAELCAILGFAAARNNDRVGLALAGAGIEHFVPPARGRTHLLRMLRDVLAAPSSGALRSADAAGFLLHTLKRRSLVFWISDFDDPVDVRTFRVLSRRHDVTAFHLRDPRDETLPRAGWVELEDLERGKRVLVNTSSKGVRQRYQREGEARRRAAEQSLAAARCERVELRTDVSYLPALLAYFNARRRGRVRA